VAKKFRVDLTRAAQRDIESIYDVIGRDNPTAAGEWIEELERQISTLEQSPARCPVIPESAELGREYRHLLYGSYRTIFRIAGSRVLVVRVIHGARLLSLTILE
jgi:plasmid stabilization system protein ParE